MADLDETQVFEPELRARMFKIARDIDPSMGDIFQNEMPVTDLDIEQEIVKGFRTQEKSINYLMELSSLRLGMVIPGGPVADHMIDRRFHVTITEDDPYGTVIKMTHRGIVIEASESAYAKDAPILQLMMKELKQSVTRIAASKCSGSPQPEASPDQ